jgi:hypothetical protein
MGGRYAQLGEAIDDRKIGAWVARYNDRFHAKCSIASS